MSLSAQLKLTRQKMLLTQEDFAAIMKVSVATINRWEKGHSKPNIQAMKNLKAFCEENNLSFDEIEKAWLAQPTEA